MDFKKAILFALLLVVPVGLMAEAFSFRHYKVEDGLSYNMVRCILQDRRGFMWFGTEDGLNRFDGIEFKVYRCGADCANGLGSNYISSLVEDADGNLWVGTDVGIFIYSPVTERFERYAVKTADGLAVTAGVGCLAIDGKGNIWASTFGQGVFRCGVSEKCLDRYNRVLGANGEAIAQVTTLYVDRDDRVWAVVRNGSRSLLLFNRDENGFATAPLNTLGLDGAAINIQKMVQLSDGSFWLGFWDQGVCRYDINNGSLQNYLSPRREGGIMHIHEMAEYKPGTLFIGSNDGLCLFDVHSLTHRLFVSNELDPASISDKFVYPIYKDREGGFWIGTYYGGINYLSPTTGMFERYTHSRFVNSVGGNVVGGFAEDSHGQIWIASDDGGLSSFDPLTRRFNTYQPEPGRNSISYNNVHALCVDGDQLWVGTYTGGLNRLDLKSRVFKHYSSGSAANTLDDNSVYCVFNDRDRTLWVTTMLGAHRYNRSTDDFTREKTFGSTTIDIEQDRFGFLWFATWGSGIFSHDPNNGQWIRYEHRTDDSLSLPGNHVNCLAIDAHSVLWAGISGNLCRYNRGADRFERVPLSVPVANVLSIVADNGLLWITTSNGLVRFNPVGGECRVYTQSDGLLSDQFIGNSGFKASNGKIYVGTAGGFNAFFPQRIVGNGSVPPVALTQLEVFNKTIATAPDGPLPVSVGAIDCIHLSHRDKVFSIGFAALSYVTPEKNVYAYKLDGFDKEWNHVGGQRKATYTNLPAGSYVFRVKAANNDGVWNDQGASVRIVIHPPLWLTTGFKLLYLLLVVAMVVAIVKVMAKRTELRHKAKMQQLNQEKEREVYNAKFEFFTMIAHEIRTPVSLIMGPLEKILANGSDVPEPVRKDLNIIDRNSHHLLALTSQLLDFRKAEQGRLTISPQRCGVGALLHEVYGRFRPLAAQKGIELLMECPVAFDAVVDEEAMVKIVSNLLSNAIKYTTDKIVLSAKPVDQRQQFVVTVTDNGTGIPDNEKEKIFEPFYQIAKGSKPGTGIGLSLVKSLVEAHHGRVSVSNALPTGASFTVTLPLSGNWAANCIAADVDRGEAAHWDATPNQYAHAPGVPAPGEKEKPLLLIVEDNEEMRQFLNDSFSGDYQTLTAVDGVDGIEQLKGREVSLIISDLMMPRMDGLALCRSLRSNVLTSHMPIVLLTAKTDVDTKVEGLGCGADAYVEKPFSVQVLKAQVRNLIETRMLLRRKFTEMPFVPLNSIAGNEADEQFLSKMSALIESHIGDEELSVDMLAEKLCISRSGLFAKIKTLAGVTPNELIQVMRLKKAAALLAENRYRISEIAYMVGFSNPSYFTKCFQKQFGVRPGEFVGEN